MIKSLREIFWPTLEHAWRCIETGTAGQITARQSRINDSRIVFVRSQQPVAAAISARAMRPQIERSKRRRLPRRVVMEEATREDRSIGDGAQEKFGEDREVMKLRSA